MGFVGTAHFVFCLIGISRIVLRYHYASDVIAGFCLALAWLSFLYGSKKN
jgi:undecaprenyl-diphosphatase